MNRQGWIQTDIYSDPDRLTLQLRCLMATSAKGQLNLIQINMELYLTRVVCLCHALWI